MGTQATENIRPIQAAVLEDLIAWAAAAERSDRAWRSAHVNALKNAAAETVASETRSDLSILWRRWLMRAEAAPVGGVEYTAWHFAAGALEKQIGWYTSLATARVGDA